MIAAFIMNCVILHQLGDGYLTAPVTMDHRLPVEPFSLNRTDLTTFLDAKPFYYGFNSSTAPEIVQKIGSWSYFDDVKGKFGLITSNVGDRITYALPKAAVMDLEHLQTANQMGVNVHFSLLKSYEHMGALKFSIFYFDGNMGSVLYEKYIDCRWQKHTSESVIESGVFDWNPWNGVSDFAAIPIDFQASGDYIYFRMEVVAPSDGARLENKVKLFYVMLY
jgi:hypothetical protein